MRFSLLKASLLSQMLPLNIIVQLCYHHAVPNHCHRMSLKKMCDANLTTYRFLKVIKPHYSDIPMNNACRNQLRISTGLPLRVFNIGPKLKEVSKERRLSVSVAWIGTLGFHLRALTEQCTAVCSPAISPEETRPCKLSSDRGGMFPSEPVSPNIPWVCYFHTRRRSGDNNRWHHHVMMMGWSFALQH